MPGTPRATCAGARSSRPLRFESPRGSALRLLLSNSSPAAPWAVPRFATTPGPCPFPPGHAGRNAIGFRGGLCPHTVRLDLCRRACSGPLSRNGSLALSRSRPPASVRRTRPPTPPLAGFCPRGCPERTRCARLARRPHRRAKGARQDAEGPCGTSRPGGAQEAPGSPPAGAGGAGPGHGSPEAPQGRQGRPGGARRDLPRYARTRGRGGPEYPHGLARSLAGNRRKSAGVTCAN